MISKLRADGDFEAHLSNRCRQPGLDDIQNKLFKTCVQARSMPFNRKTGAVRDGGGFVCGVCSKAATQYSNGADSNGNCRWVRK